MLVRSFKDFQHKHRDERPCARPLASYQCIVLNAKDRIETTRQIAPATSIPNAFAPDDRMALYANTKANTKHKIAISNITHPSIFDLLQLAHRQRRCLKTDVLQICYTSINKRASKILVVWGEGFLPRPLASIIEMLL